MERRESLLKKFLRAAVAMCSCCVGAGYAFLVQEESMKKVEGEKKGSTEYYDRF